MNDIELAERIQKLVDTYRIKLGVFAKVEEIESDTEFIKEKEKLIKEYTNEKLI